jgi:hypothetical protein
MGFLKPPSPQPAAPPPMPAPFVSNPKPAPQRKPMSPTFLGAEATPQSGPGPDGVGMKPGKTLMGQ